MQSIWENISMPQFPALSENIECEVLVIGGGITGLLTAYKLKQAGIRCVVAEAATIASGITKNTTAKITAQHGILYHKIAQDLGEDAAHAYYAANQEAVQNYRMLCKDIDCDFTICDAYVYAENDPRILECELRVLDKIGAPAEFTEKTELPFSVCGAIRLPDQASFHPLKFLAAIAKDLPIYEHSSVQKLAGNVAYTEHGSIRADKVIVTTHFPFINRHGLYFLKLYQSRSYVLALQGAETLDGMYIDGENGSLSFRSAQDTLLIGCGNHRTGKRNSGWTEAEVVLRRYYPHAKITHRWATQDCMTPDGIPYIGQYAKTTPDLFVATGFNKWGMSTAMVAANLLTDLIREKENRFAPLFSPSRSMLKPQLAANAWESATNLLRLSRPRCPHLGCALRWNKRERTWDCPCHGSRFTEHGELIDNPAHKGLRKPPKKP